MMGTPPLGNYPRGHPAWRAPSDVAFRQWLPICPISPISPISPTSQIIVEIEIDSRSAWHLALSAPQQYGFAIRILVFEPILPPFDTEADSDPDLASPSTFSNDN